MEASAQIFVNSMSDLFHENVSDEWINKIFAVMALSPQHEYQVLTKRPARMLQWFSERWQPTPSRRVTIPELGVLDIPAQAEGDDRHERVYQAASDFLDTTDDRFWNSDGSRKWPGWPLPNVWLGVSVEDQKTADERIPLLLQTPAAIRFISAEPLLGPIDFRTIRQTVAPGYFGDCLHWYHQPLCNAHIPYPTVNWVIVGGESGPGARPMHGAWVADIQTQCAEEGVAFFFKQWGAWCPGLGSAAGFVSLLNGERFAGSAKDTYEWGDGYISQRVGKKRAGRLLAGREWNEMPEMHHA